MQHILEIFYFYEQGGVGYQPFELGLILLYAGGGLEHELGSIADQMTKPRRSPSGTSTVFSKPMRSTQKGSDFSIFSTMRTAVIFICAMLENRRGGGIGKNGHGRTAGELAEIADEVGLVEIAGFEGDLHPVWLAGGLGERGCLAEAQDAAEVLWSESALFETAAAEVAGLRLDWRAIQSRSARPRDWTMASMARRTGSGGAVGWAGIFASGRQHRERLRAALGVRARGGRAGLRAARHGRLNRRVRRGGILRPCRGGSALRWLGSRRESGGAALPSWLRWPAGRFRVKKRYPGRHRGGPRGRRGRASPESRYTPPIGGGEPGRVVRVGARDVLSVELSHVRKQ